MPYKDPQKRRDHYAANKDIINAKVRDYRVKNRSRFLALDRTVTGRHKVLRFIMKKEKVEATDLLWNINFYTALIMGAICHYCLGILNETGGGLDRISNDVGHTCFNVVPCCRKCNRIKGNDTSYEEMFLLVPALREIVKLKSLKAVA